MGAVQEGRVQKRDFDVDLAAGTVTPSGTRSCRATLGLTVASVARRETFTAGAFGRRLTCPEASGGGAGTLL